MRQSSKQCYTTGTTGRGRTSKSHHLLHCQMLMCQDQCPRCLMFRAGGQNGFGTSLTQLASATPCQQTGLMHICEKEQRQQSRTSTHVEMMQGLCMVTAACQLTRWFGFNISLRGGHSIKDQLPVETRN